MRRARSHADLHRLKLTSDSIWQDYRRLVIRRGDAVGNQFRAWRFFFEEDYTQLGKPTGRGGTFQALFVNAFYNAQRNEIDLPAAILRSPFFEADGDMASNFGALGTYIGHEISHAFDDQGRQFDGAGNLRNWWTTADADSFNLRVDQLVTQYDAYFPIAGVHVNGRRTVGENMSDLGGLAVAYQAYRSSRTGDTVVGGLSGDQRFFVAYARRQRWVGRDEAPRVGLLSDSHSPLCTASTARSPIFRLFTTRGACARGTACIDRSTSAFASGDTTCSHVSAHTSPSILAAARVHLLLGVVGRVLSCCCEKSGWVYVGGRAA